MSKSINEELIELASEFATLRQAGKRSWFPDAIWQKAILLAQQLPIPEICRAIKVHPAYFRKKQALLAPKNSDQSLTFLELTPVKPRTIAVHVVSSCGHKLSVDGLVMSDLTSILSEFLKGGTPCCK
jgi:hypothetical protein